MKVGQLDFPLWLVHLQDKIFKGLEDSSKWVEELSMAVPEGADLTPVLPKFLKFIVESNPSNKLHYEPILKLLDQWIRTGILDQSRAQSLEAAACSASRGAEAERKPEAATWKVACAMVYITENSERHAALWTAAATERGAAQRPIVWRIIADELIRLIKDEA